MKLVDDVKLDAALKSMADAIRSKSGSEDELTFDEESGFSSAIGNIPQASLNIAYGQTAPEDTSKIWVKADEPESISINNTPDVSGIIIQDTGLTFDRLSRQTITNSGAVVGDWLYTLFYDTNLYLDKLNLKTGEFVAGSNPIGEGDSIVQGLQACSYNDKLFFAGAKPSGSIATPAVGITNTSESIINIKNTDASAMSDAGKNFYLSKVPCFEHNGFVYWIPFTSKNGGGSSCKVYKIDATNFTTTKINEINTYKLTPYAGYTTYVNTGSPWSKIGNKIYSFQSDIRYYSGSYDYWQVLANNGYIYDINTNEFEILDKNFGLGSNLYNCPCAVSLGTKIYFLGTGNGNNVIGAYDVQTGQSSTLQETLPFSLSNFGSVKFDGQGYCYFWGGSSTNTKLYKMQLTWDLPENNMELYLYDNGFSKAKLLNTDILKQSVSGVRAYVGDSNNKATSAPVYYHDGTDWVEFV